MGIRFRCPNGHKLNVKSFQAKMRGVCPYCGAKFTVPAQSAEPLQDPLAENSQALWYVRPPSGGQFGPADGNVMRDWLKDGRITADSLVWREGWQDWAQAVTVFPKLALVRFPQEDEAAKKTPPPPPQEPRSEAPLQIQLGEEEASEERSPIEPFVDTEFDGKRYASKSGLARRGGGRRRPRRAREIKNQRVNVVIALSVMVVALACVAFWLLW